MAELRKEARHKVKVKLKEIEADGSFITTRVLELLTKAREDARSVLEEKSKRQFMQKIGTAFIDIESIAKKLRAIKLTLESQEDADESSSSSISSGDSESDTESTVSHFTQTHVEVGDHAGVRSLTTFSDKRSHHVEHSTPNKDVSNLVDTSVCDLYESAIDCSHVSNVSVLSTLATHQQVPNKSVDLSVSASAPQCVPSLPQCVQETVSVTSPKCTDEDSLTSENTIVNNELVSQKYAAGSDKMENEPELSVSGTETEELLKIVEGNAQLLSQAKTSTAFPVPCEKNKHKEVPRLERDTYRRSSSKAFSKSDEGLPSEILDKLHSLVGFDENMSRQVKDLFRDILGLRSESQKKGTAEILYSEDAIAEEQSLGKSDIVAEDSSKVEATFEFDVRPKKEVSQPSFESKTAPQSNMPACDIHKDSSSALKDSIIDNKVCGQPDNDISLQMQDQTSKLKDLESTPTVSKLSPPVAKTHPEYEPSKRNPEQTTGPRVPRSRSRESVASRQSKETRSEGSSRATGSSAKIKRGKGAPKVLKSACKPKKESKDSKPNEKEILLPTNALKPCKIEQGKMYGIYITEVFNPSLFWVNLQDTAPELEDMMDSIRQFYEPMSKNHQYFRLHSMPKAGTLVVARYSQDGKWYRARINAVWCDYVRGNRRIEVEVLYVDFGNRAKLLLEDIKPLHPNFIELSAQAFPCALSQTAPAHGMRWEQNQDCVEFARQLLDRADASISIVGQEGEDCALTFVEIYVPDRPLPTHGSFSRRGPVASELVKISDVLTNKLQWRRVSNAELARQFLDNMEYNTYDVTHEALSTALHEIRNHVLQKAVMATGDACASNVVEKIERHHEVHRPENQSTCRPITAQAIGVDIGRKKTHCTSTHEAAGGKHPNADLAGESAQPSAATRNPGRKSPIGITSKLPKPPKQCLEQYEQDKKAGKSLEASKEIESCESTQNQPVPRDSGLHENRNNSAIKPNTDSSNPDPENSKPDAEDKPDSLESKSQPGSLASRSSSKSYTIHHPLQEVQLKDDGSFSFMVSYIKSPVEFWVHPLQSDTVSKVNEIMDGLRDFYSSANADTMNRFYEDEYEPGHLVCARFSQDDRIYRAEILDVKHRKARKLQDAPEKKRIELEKHTYVKVYYVDFGNREIIDVRRILPLPLLFKDTPGLAVKCSMYNTTRIIPENNDTGSWNVEAVTKFEEVLGYQTSFLGFVMNYAGSETIQPSVNDPLQIALVDTTGEDDIWLNENLPRLGIAHFTATDEYNRLQNSKYPIPESETGVKTEQDNLDEAEALQKWDPMGKDFLSEENSYFVDRDDPGMAATNYNKDLIYTEDRAMGNILSAANNEPYISLWLNHAQQCMERRSKATPTILPDDFHVDFKLHLHEIKQAREEKNRKIIEELDDILDIPFETEAQRFAKERISLLLKGDFALGNPIISDAVAKSGKESVPEIKRKTETEKDENIQRRTVLNCRTSECASGHKFMFIRLNKTPRVTEAHRSELSMENKSNKPQKLCSSKPLKRGNRRTRQRAKKLEFSDFAKLQIRGIKEYLKERKIKVESKPIEKEGGKENIDKSFSVDVRNQGRIRMFCVSPLGTLQDESLHVLLPAVDFPCAKTADERAEDESAVHSLTSDTGAPFTTMRTSPLPTVNTNIDLPTMTNRVPPNIQNFPRPQMLTLPPPTNCNFSPPTIKPNLPPSMYNFPPPTVNIRPPPTIFNFPPPSLGTSPPPTIFNFPPPSLAVSPPPTTYNFPPPSLAVSPPPTTYNFPPPSLAVSPPPITYNFPSPSMATSQPVTTYNFPPPAMTRIPWPTPVCTSVPPRKHVSEAPITSTCAPPRMSINTPPTACTSTPKCEPSPTPTGAKPPKRIILLKSKCTSDLGPKHSTIPPSKRPRAQLPKRTKAQPPKATGERPCKSTNAQPPKHTIVPRPKKTSAPPSKLIMVGPLKDTSASSPVPRCTSAPPSNSADAPRPKCSSAPPSSSADKRRTKCNSAPPSNSADTPRPKCNSAPPSNSADTPRPKCNNVPPSNSADTPRPKCNSVPPSNSADAPRPMCNSVLPSNSADAPRPKCSTGRSPESTSEQSPTPTSAPPPVRTSSPPPTSTSPRLCACTSVSPTICTSAPTVQSSIGTPDAQQQNGTSSLPYSGVPCVALPQNNEPSNVSQPRTGTVNPVIPNIVRAPTGVVRPVRPVIRSISFTFRYT